MYRTRCCLLGLLALIVPPLLPALAVQPAGPFSASGTLLLSKGKLSVSCEASFAGHVGADGRVRIEQVQFRGEHYMCARLTPLALPWQAQAESATLLRLEGLRVQIRSLLVGGECGAATVRAQWRPAESAVEFAQVALAPACTLHGRLYTAPRLAVTP